MKADPIFRCVGLAGDRLLAFGGQSEVSEGLLGLTKKEVGIECRGLAAAAGVADSLVGDYRSGSTTCSYWTARAHRGCGGSA